MSPLESFQFLNRGWDVRLLENQSPRSVFLMLLLDVFMLEMLTSIMLHKAVRLHCFDWPSGFLLIVFILPVFRYGGVIYRRLER
jgi:hypothetical protein